MKVVSGVRPAIGSLRDEVEYLRKCWAGVADHVSWVRSALSHSGSSPAEPEFRDPLLPLELVFVEIRSQSTRVAIESTGTLSLIIVLEGRCVVDSGSDVASVAADEAFAVSLDEGCFVALTKESDSAIIARLRFHPDIVTNSGYSFLDSQYLQPFCDAASVDSRHVHNSAPESNEIIRQLWGIYEDLKSNDEMYRLHVHARLLNLLLPLAEYHRRHIGKTSDARPDRRTRLRRVFQYLEKNYSRKITLSTVSSIAMMSENYFCRIFKSTTGLSFIQYLSRLRIDRAKELLRNSSIGIADISFEVGFSNYNYFDRIFRRQTNLSPTRYRSENSRHTPAHRRQTEHPLAVSMSALDNVGWAAIHIGMIAAENQPDQELFTLSAGNSIDEQLDQVDDFIDENAKVIILNPVNSNKAANAVLAANRAGIPVVCVDRSTEGGEVATLVESDNVACGAVAAQLMASAAPRRRLQVLVLQGDLSTSAAVERNQGFVSALQAQGEVSIQMTLPCYWNARFAQEAVLYALGRCPEIDAIFLPSDNAYITAVVASLRTLGRLYPCGHSLHVVVVTVDGSPAVLDQIRLGYVDGVAAQNLYGMGTMAMSSALRIATGLPIEQPIIRIPPMIITGANVETASVWGNLICRISGVDETAGALAMRQPSLTAPVTELFTE